MQETQNQYLDEVSGEYEDISSGFSTMIALQISVTSAGSERLKAEISKRE